jgi:hypothetical protein
MARALKIIIDENDAGRLKNSSTESLQISPGPHSFRVSMDWCTSPTLSVIVAEGQTVRLEATVPSFISLDAWIGVIAWPQRVFGLRQL